MSGIDTTMSIRVGTFTPADGSPDELVVVVTEERSRHQFRLTHAAALDFADQLRLAAMPADRSGGVYI